MLNIECISLNGAGQNVPPTVGEAISLPLAKRCSVYPRLNGTNPKESFCRSHHILPFNVPGLLSHLGREDDILPYSH